MVLRNFTAILSVKRSLNHFEKLPNDCIKNSFNSTKFINRTIKSKLFSSLKLFDNKFEEIKTVKLKFVPFQSKLSKRFSTSDTFSEEKFTEEKKDEEPTTKKIVGYWYLVSSSLVFLIVVVGGLTRLTESGLSIVEWNLIKGMKPPTSEEEWLEEFNKYKQFPEFIKTNHKMKLDEFKFIFYMEWGHRMIGRVIGLAFILPGIYFYKKNYMSKKIQSRSLLVGSLIGLQGLIGWYMVKSGLSAELLENAHAIPRVSQYWLALHLGSAFAIYSLSLVTGLGILKANRPTNYLNNLKIMLSNPMLKPFRTYTHATTGLIFFTAMSGAFVAGLDAGLIYNEFPYMGNSLIPSDMWAISDGSTLGVDPKPWYLNFLENPATVQFDHRVLAMLTATSVFSLWVYARKLKLPKNARYAVNSLLGVCILQVSLGISTLIWLVPVPLAAAHQAGSLTLLSTALWLMHTLKRIK